MSRYAGRHRATNPPLWRRPAVLVPTLTTALAAATVGVAAHSAATPSAHAAASSPPRITAQDASWQRATQGVSRADERPSAAEAGARAAAAERSRAAALVRASSAASAARSKAAWSTTPARAKATARGARHTAAGSSRGAGSGWTCVISGCGGTFTSGFGGRWGTMHRGDDFATPVGTPLHALHAGRVVAVGYYGGMGNRVEIDYGGGVTSVFAHMSGFAAAAGQQVRAGQLVGYSGNTGHSTGPHLHLEIHLNGRPVNPAPWLRAHGIF